MRVEDIGERVEVLAVCSSGSIKPLRFKWSGRAYEVQDVNARWTARSGGREMMFLTLDDEFGLFEATLFPDQSGVDRFDSYGPHIITGKVSEKYGSITIGVVR